MIRNTKSLLDLLEVALEKFPRDFCGADVTAEKGTFSGTVYPLLRRLEKVGWLTSSWEEIDPESVGRPKRRMFRLTNAGLSEANVRLKTNSKAWSKLLSRGEA